MSRSTFPRLEAIGAAALMLFASAGIAQDTAPAAVKAAECGSVVIVRCEKPPPQTSTRDAAQRIESRRLAASDPLELDRIIIEADPIRRSMEEALTPPFTRPSHGTHTFRTAEGSQCSCMNRCPPIPFPCCQCSVHPSRFSRSPGVTPLQ